MGRAKRAARNLGAELRKSANVYGGIKSSLGKSSMVELVGDKELARELMNMADNAATRIMRPAIRKGLVIGRQEAKDLVSVRSGQLRRAISARSKVNKAKAKVIGWLTVRRGKAIQYKGRKHDPSKIAHLVEFGTRHSKPHPFLTVAMDNRRSEIKAIITAVAKEKLAYEARKAATRGRSL